MWVEIWPLSETKSLKKKWEIAQKPPLDFEIRVIIWDCKGIPMVDAEGCTDIFFSCKFGEDLE